ncbi:uracil-DNA glycosylase [Candidatus Gottesmanbacteria bacterium]|nr:uracil-DNA glycosylase [Candidatus Gottesmanbacteria bacterium]
MYKLLEELHKKINNCRKCPLYKTAKHAVPGEGNPKTKIVFVGEAPGRVEDETGRPFVGRAGKLLNELLDSIGLKRESVFITSVVKHRPPKNRQPKSPEIKRCSFWLKHQLSIIKPELIVTLGRFGMEYFLPKEKISQIHGTIKKTLVNERFISVFPVYHPAAGLRSTRNKKRLFEDFQKLKKTISHDF